MLREAVGTGETVVEAQEDACRQLGVETHDAEFDIIQMPEKKKFGLFGGNPAKVKAYIKLSPAEEATSYLKSILNAMNLSQIDVQLTENEDGAEINLEGEDVGAVIGRRGETLDALQYLAGLVANHVDDTYYRITINTGNYREKREKTLEALGKKLAFKTLKTGRKNFLEPMNPYERRIIHTAVQKVNGVISWSEGENINRHVVIGIDPKVKRHRTSNSYNKGSRKPYNKPYNKNSFYNKDNSERFNKNTEATSAQISDRKPMNEGGDFSLYGRIDKNN